MFDVIIVAAGKSLRAKTDKLSASHGESTVLGRTIEVFRNEDQIKNIILVTDIQGEFFGVKKVPGGK
ncbi:MAG: 2-C-methyl-D-erythritol 4-phosphate cytidylyltransferase, partial [Clostridia bacterium]|nr:2-C-methyl-D-erythritol 4-phosphate cytidylyltransferase [Clostridia bacterium]